MTSIRIGYIVSVAVIVLVAVGARVVAVKGVPVPGAAGTAFAATRQRYATYVAQGPQPDRRSLTQIGSSFAVEAWIKPTTVGGAYQPILSQHPARDSPNSQTSFNLQIQASGAINFFAGCGVPGAYGWLIGEAVAMANVWTHVAVSASWSDRINHRLVTMWINGTKHATRMWAQGYAACENRTRYVPSPSTHVSVGFFDNIDSGVQTFDGLVDEVRIWNTSLTTSQVRGHMHGSVNPQASGLMLYSQFNDERVVGNDAFSPGLVPGSAVAQWPLRQGDGAALRSSWPLRIDAAVQAWDFAASQVAPLHALTADAGPASVASDVDFWLTGALFPARSAPLLHVLVNGSPVRLQTPGPGGHVEQLLGPGNVTFTWFVTPNDMPVSGSWVWSYEARLRGDDTPGMASDVRLALACGLASQACPVATAAPTSAGSPNVSKDEMKILAVIGLTVVAFVCVVVIVVAIVAWRKRRAADGARSFSVLGESSDDGSGSTDAVSMHDIVVSVPL